MPATKRQRSVLCNQFIKTRGFSLFRSEFRRRLLRAGLDSPNHFFGTAITGIWGETIVRRVISRLPSGINELMTHPGECDADLRRQPTRLLESREQERDILIAPSFRTLLRSQEIVLTHYGEIAR
jgi:chitin disaccharide deacetylase